MMNILAEPFWTQKRGSSPSEYEDAACPVERHEYTSTNVRMAVADGATESVFARRWAEQLVFAVADGELSPRGLAEGLSHLRGSWREWLAGQSHPWYVEEKSRQGAFAALVALEFAADESDGNSEGSWYASAIGDSCVFQVRAEEVLVRFPLAEPELFDSRPTLISSIASDSPDIEVSLNGTWLKGDVFYLMTDALACWFLTYLKSGGSPSSLQDDFAISSEGRTFEAWVELLRDQGAIRNDDCTLLRVSIL